MRTALYLRVSTDTQTVDNQATRCYSELCGREFASLAERQRGEDLALLERAGEITNLEYQPLFVLCKSPKINYTADFRYTENDKVIVEDVKGFLTRETRVKIAWLKEKTGIEVSLIGRG